MSVAFTQPKLCVSCNYYIVSELCGHPTLVMEDVVQGGHRPRSAPRMRETDGPCGPEARLWVGRSDPGPGLPDRRASLDGAEPPERPEPYAA